MSTSTSAPVGSIAPLRCTALVITFPLRPVVLCESLPAPLSTAYGGRAEVSRAEAHLFEAVTGIAFTLRLRMYPSAMEYLQRLWHTASACSIFLPTAPHHPRWTRAALVGESAISASLHCHASQARLLERSPFQWTAPAWLVERIEGRSAYDNNR